MADLMSVASETPRRIGTNVDWRLTMFLGLDIGTSQVKGAVVSNNGDLISQITAPITTARRRKGWAEQDPDQWWQSVEAIVAKLSPELRRAIRGIGLAGQMHGATLLGMDDQPLRSAILWNDGRSATECAELERAVPDSRLITGNLAMPGFTAPKLLWVRKHEPEIFAQLKTVLLPKDYVRLRMTGDRISDMSDSAGTLWLDVARRRWSEPMLEACGLEVQHMPHLLEGSVIGGQLRRDIATAWGMEAVPVVAGGSDNAASAAGVGVIEDGEALLSLGTSGVIFVATNEFRPNADSAVHAFCHCLPNRWHQMSVHLSAASCVDWAARAIGVDGPGSVFTLAEQAGLGSGSELFLPYLSGERTPHNDPHIRGALLGLDNDSDAGRIAGAVLEGVAFALVDGLAALRDAGTAVESLSVVGGGARSRYWGRILAAALGVTLVYLEGGDVGPALGAAKLAQIGVAGRTPRDACVRPPIAHFVEPDALLAEQLAPRRNRFRAAFAAVQSI